MITIENVNVSGFEAAIRGMRNPMNSWDKSDSKVLENTYGYANPDILIGKNDLNLMKSLIKSGTDHSKFLRMVYVSFDIIAPLYWWKEFDTYKIGTVSNSCSTMHTIHKDEFTEANFSQEQIKNLDGIERRIAEYDLDRTIKTLNYFRNKYNETKEKRYWYIMIQKLPSSYNQRRTISTNYQVLINIHRQRCNHKLNEWIGFCDFILRLPYMADFILWTYE